MWLIAALLTAVVGMGWIALSYESHWQQVFPNGVFKPEQVRLKAAGWGSLLVSGGCCLAADHPSMAVLVWVMLLTLSAVAVAMLLSRQPGLLRMICPSAFAANA
jgi:hypothetical protein